MAKNITLMGADYPDVPAVQLPQTGGGTATFYDINVIDDLNSVSSTDALSAKQGKVLDEKKLEKNVVYNSIQNATQFSFEASGRNSSSFWFALMYLATSSTNFGLYMIFIDTNGTVSVGKLAGTNNRTFTGQLSGNTVTLTASDTVYGGIRIIKP